MPVILERELLLQCSLRRRYDVTSVIVLQVRISDATLVQLEMINTISHGTIGDLGKEILTRRLQ